MVFLFCCLVAIVVVSLVLSPLVREARTEAPAVDSASTAQERKNRVYTAILELDFDFECGKVTADDYQRLRERYLGQARLLLPEEEATPSVTLAPESPVTSSPTPSAPPQCESCGAALPDEARYCFLCGLAVPA